MFEDLHEYPIESQRLRWESKVVVRDHEYQARLYLRLHLTGTSFPRLDSLPFVRVGEVKARFVDITEGDLSVKAYFDTALPSGGRVEFGYDDKALLRFPEPYDEARVVRLVVARLPEELRYQDSLFTASAEPRRG